MRHASIALVVSLSALLLAGCETTRQQAYPYATPPGDARRDSVETLRGNPQARVIVREGPFINSETVLSPEESARQEAGQYCASVNLEARVLDISKQRVPARMVMRSGSASEYERVQLTFMCERGMP